jgi:hypothetical protein
MKTYLFLLAWVDGSEGASGDPTNVHGQDDLLPEYQKGSEYIFALYIRAPNEGVASNYGYARAFHENYTGYDTVSTCELVKWNIPNPCPIPFIVVDTQEY